MAATVACPNCSKVYRIREKNLGSQAQCRSCGHTFTLQIKNDETSRPAMVSGEANSPFASAASHLSVLGQPSGDCPIPEKVSPSHQPARIGPYVILEWLGCGAMGEVWRGHDPDLDREVAIKTLRPEHAKDTEYLQRFVREARMAAKLNHANAVTIYRVGADGNRVYIAMEMLDGEPLDKVVSGRGPMPWREATRAIRDAAASLAAAHEIGLVHRDIKPSNLMWTRDRSTKVVDFGLARAQAASVQLTQQGMLMGTPAYMAPELWAGKEADARSDVYALACTYYCLLTGRVPFDASTVPSLGYQHRYEPFPDPRQLATDLPEEICRILARGAAKQPSDRYQNAAELLVQLEALLTAPQESLIVGDALGEADTSKQKRRHGPAERWDELPRRYLKNTWTTLAGAAKSLLSGSGSGRTKRMAIAAAVPGGAAILLGVTLYIHNGNGKVKINTSSDVEVRGDGDTVDVRELNETKAKDGRSPAPPRQHVGDRLSWPVDRLRREDIPAYEMRMAGFGGRLQVPQELVAVFGDSRFRSWSRPSLWGKGGDEGFQSVAISRDSRLIAASHTGGFAVVWDRATGEEQCMCRGTSEHGLSGVDFSPDGATLAMWSVNRSLGFYKVASGAEVQLLESGADQVGPAVFTPDGKFLIAAGRDNKLTIWELATKRRFRTLSEEHPGGVHCLAVSGDGRYLFSAARQQGAWLWNCSEGEVLHRLECPGNIVHAEFQADGSRVAAAGRNPGAPVLVWEAATGKLELSYNAHMWGNCSATLSPDGSMIATAGVGTCFLRIFDGRTNELRRNLTYGEIGRAAKFTADGRFLVLAGQGPNVRIWETATWQEEIPPERHVAPVIAVAISPDGEDLVSVGCDNKIRFWGLADGQRRRTLDAAANYVSSVGFSADGAVLVSTIKDAVAVWDLASGYTRQTWRSSNILCSAAISPSGGAVAFGGGDRDRSGNLQLGGLDTRQSSPIALPEKSGAVNAVAFSPDGELVAAGTWNGLVGVSSTKTLKLVQSLAGHSGVVYSVAFNPDGTTLASADSRNSIRLWDTKTWYQRTATRDHEGEVYCVRFSPDGDRLASCGADGTVRLWNASTGDLMTTIRCAPQGHEILRVAFTPDGRHLVTANGNGTIYVLRLEQAAASAAPPVR